MWQTEILSLKSSLLLKSLSRPKGRKVIQAAAAQNTQKELISKKAEGRTCFSDFLLESHARHDLNGQISEAKKKSEILLEEYKFVNNLHFTLQFELLGVIVQNLFFSSALLQLYCVSHL